MSLTIVAKCFKGASALCLLVLLAQPLFRKPSYEIFLRTHQALAALFAYSVWRHLPSENLFPRFYIYLAAGLFLSSVLLSCWSILYHNGFFRYHCPRAYITNDSGTVKIRIVLQKPLKIDAGQYINLWIPSVSFWSFLQMHPFTVVSWASGQQDALELFIEPRRGLTRHLFHQSQHGGSNLLSMFSGPHGESVAMDKYETILMVASGFGIAAHLPHLKKLIHGYNSRDICARRIHLVWQIREIGKLFSPLINSNGSRR